MVYFMEIFCVHNIIMFYYDISYGEFCVFNIIMFNYVIFYGDFFVSII